MKKHKHEVKITEGFKAPRVDPAFDHATIEQLDKLPAYKVSRLPPMRRRHSQINAARRRYVMGDDGALDEA